MLETPIPPPRALWHATPLKNLEDILRDKSLHPFAIHPDHGSHPPRAGKTRSRRKHGSAVYLAPIARSAFHCWHVREGIPCVQLIFSPDLIANPEVGLVRCNGKAWRHRDDFRPVHDPHEKTELLAQWRAGKWPSLECLVPHRLPLDHHWWGIAFPESARETIFSLLRAAGRVPESGSVPQLHRHNGRPIWETIALPESTAIWLRAESMPPRLLATPESADNAELPKSKSAPPLFATGFSSAPPASQPTRRPLTGLPTKTPVSRQRSIP